jgi:uncharacterized protein (UPF0248 family)
LPTRCRWNFPVDPCDYQLSENTNQYQFWRTELNDPSEKNMSKESAVYSLLWFSKGMEGNMSASNINGVLCKQTSNSMILLQEHSLPYHRMEIGPVFSKQNMSTWYVEENL